MTYLIKSFHFAVHGVLSALMYERNFRLQWLAGLMVLTFINLVSLEWLENIILFMLVILVLALELQNCALEKACDSTGKSFQVDKKLAKDHGAGAVLIAAFGAFSVFFAMVWHYRVNILDSFSAHPLAWLLWVSLFVVNVPVVFAQKSKTLWLLFYVIGLLLNGLLMWQKFEEPLFLSVAVFCHITFGIALFRRSEIRAHF